MKKTFAPEILRISYIAETRGEAEAVDLMVEYLLQYGNDLLAKLPENMLFIARPAVARANEILAEREKAETAETVETEETVETKEEPAVEDIDVDNVINALSNGRGLGALNAMIGANCFLNGGTYIQFRFKGCKKANVATIKYNKATDLYNMEFGKLVNKNYVKQYKSVLEYTGLFIGDLKTTFENYTELYLTLY